MAAKKSKRSDGRYEVQVFLGRDEHGKSIRKSVYGQTIKEAREKADIIRLRYNKGLEAETKRDTFGWWAARWLESKKTEVSIKRYRSYVGNIRHLEPLNEMQMSHIRPMDIQRVIDSLDLSKQTMSNIRCAASQVFSYAIANQLIDSNPASAVKIPKTATAPKKRRSLTEEEQNAIRMIQHRAQVAAMVMLYAGLRRGEMMALKWQDIDLYEKTITVNKSVEFDSNQPILKDGAKTEAGTRVIPIPNILVDFLRTVERTGELVCPSARGSAHTETSYRRMWESYTLALKKKAGINDKITAHMLRHTYVTMLYLSGVDVLTASKLAGHADVKITMDIYTHLDQEHKVSSMDKLNDYLSVKKSVFQSNSSQRIQIMQ